MNTAPGFYPKLFSVYSMDVLINVPMTSLTLNRLQKSNGRTWNKRSNKQTNFINKIEYRAWKSSKGLLLPFGFEILAIFVVIVVGLLLFTKLSSFFKPLSSSVCHRRIRTHDSRRCVICPNHKTNVLSFESIATKYTNVDLISIYI